MRRWFREGLPRAVTDCYVFLMLLVLPLFMVNGYYDITLSKFLFCTCLTGLWLLALIAACVVEALKKRFVRPKLRLPQIFILAFMLIGCLSTIFSPYGAEIILNAGQRYEGLVLLLCYGLIFLGVSWFGRLRKAHALAFAAAVTICCVIAILQLLNLNPFWLFPGTRRYHDLPLTGQTQYPFLGTIGNIDLLSALFCLAVPFFTALAVRRGGRAWLLLLPAALSTFVLVSSRVAGGIVGLGAAVLICAPVFAEDGDSFRRMCSALAVLGVTVGLALCSVWPNGRDVAAFHLRLGLLPLLAFGAATLLAVCALLPDLFPKAFRRPRKGVAIFCAALVVLGFVGLWFYPGQSGTLYEASQVLHGNAQDSFGSHRVEIWRGVLNLVPERPLLGGGPGTVRFRLADMVFTRYVPETGQTLTAGVDNAHNEFFGYLANIGILGLLAYLCAIAVSLKRFFKRRDALSSALGGAVLCYWAQSFFGLGLCFVTPLMWLMWGLFCGDSEINAGAAHRAARIHDGTDNGTPGCASPTDTAMFDILEPIITGEEK